ncbi:unnamed protein product [Tetraodon nigroviridis]|uniref:Chromosome undetermined SCAF15013, whole genome shotgun sequence n=1 Tax=Tetraodon nigroviridis TaxID=99883 RepID=Q4RNF1_TETNG|nr:unnamed protein product [Tetraodon nigroviridis]
MADSASESDTDGAGSSSATPMSSSASNAGKPSIVISQFRLEELTNRLASLQQENKVLKIELETFKLKCKALQEENRDLRKASVTIVTQMRGCRPGKGSVGSLGGRPSGHRGRPETPRGCETVANACVCGRRVADGGDGGGCVSPQQARAEQEEEFISNTLFKKIQALQKEKETLAVNYEKEEEFLTNELSRKLHAAAAREGGLGAAPGAGAGVPGEQADEEDQEDGERNHRQAADPGTATAGEDRPGEHAGAGAGSSGQQTVEADGQAGGGEEVSPRSLGAPPPRWSCADVLMCSWNQNPPGEAGPAGIGPSLPPGRLHGDRLPGEHDATHPLPEERGGAAEEEPAHHRAAAHGETCPVHRGGAAHEGGEHPPAAEAAAGRWSAGRPCAGSCRRASPAWRWTTRGGSGRSSARDRPGGPGRSLTEPSGPLRYFNEMSAQGLRARTVSSPIPYTPSPSSSRPISPGLSYGGHTVGFAPPATLSRAAISHYNSPALHVHGSASHAVARPSPRRSASPDKFKRPTPPPSPNTHAGAQSGSAPSAPASSADGPVCVVSGSHVAARRRAAALPALAPPRWSALALQQLPSPPALEDASSVPPAPREAASAGVTAAQDGGPPQPCDLTL